MYYILGGGITGLIWAYYNPQYKIVTKDLGGQMNSDFQLGPRYLHDTKNAQTLLKQLGIPVEQNTINISYIDDRGIIEQPDLSFRRAYYMKSRNTTDLSGFDSSVMNSNKSSFSSLNVDFPKLISRLQNAIGEDRFFFGNAEFVDTENKLIHVEGNVFLEFEHVVSTIPLNIFNRISNRSDEGYESYHMTYVLASPRLDSSLQKMNADFIYDARTTTPYHRITRDKRGVVLDFFGIREEDELKQFLGSHYIDSVTLYNCQIISHSTTPVVDNVTFVGRYGTWNRKWKTETVIDAAVESSKNVKGVA